MNVYAKLNYEYTSGRQSKKYNSIDNTNNNNDNSRNQSVWRPVRCRNEVLNESTKKRKKKKEKRGKEYPKDTMLHSSRNSIRERLL